MEPPRSKNIKVLIADDHPSMVRGVKDLLSTRPHIQIVGEALDGNEVVAKTTSLVPDIVIMDISMPGMNGLEATLRIREKMPQTKIIIHTMYGEREYVAEFLESGASGYVLKNNSPEELLQAIDIVFAGGAYFSPSVSQIIIEEYKGLKPAYPDGLTQHEVNVILLITQETFGNKQAAEKLKIEVSTMKKHRENIYKKTGCHTLAELMQYAVKNKIIRIKR
jgi:DNA-binding NarL/FixJ family response regulator